ncbi:MAG: anthranilate synthase component I family protein [Candidatus Omnitrophota bacterium]|nr:anthranilate synthase component I family protein [Candidatus Omnitrophota bacterium]
MMDIFHESLDFSGRGFEVFSAFREKPYVFLLESSLASAPLGRFSFIGYDPYDVFSASGPRAFENLRRRFLKAGKTAPCRLTPFPAGMMGFLSYDLGLHFEGIKRRTPDDIGTPECLAGFYDTVITVDHVLKKLHITSTGLPEKSRALRRQRALARIRAARQRLSEGVAARFDAGRAPAGSFRSNFTKDGYRRAVRAALEHIRRGDIYQVNLSQRFCFEAGRGSGIGPVRLYESLRRLSPSSFGGYFDAGGFQIVSSSPERFLCLRGRNVETRPMKGTRPRGATSTQDRENRRELVQSPKDKAELLMITDLERNDLGRVCEYGSVRVRRMRTLEKYRTVYQATSTIEGALRRDRDAFDLLKACFPGGSITGCPKIRSMEVIEELEPSRRSLYTGSLGYISLSGNLDFNILIRTMLVKGRKVYFHAGGGIVADSDPDAEYEETLVKAKAMRECLQ